MKTVSINQWPGRGGMVQVAGTDVFAKAAIKILKQYNCEETGWTVTGSAGARIYTYRVLPEVWKEVRSRLENLDKELQGSLF
jgi:hypothetical protein